MCLQAADFLFLVLFLNFTDAVCSGLHSHQPVLLHGKVWLPGSPLDPPYLDLRCLLFPPLLQLLDTGLREGQAAPFHGRDAETERFDQWTHLSGAQWETPGERTRAPPRQRQSLTGQSKRNLTLTVEMRRRLRRATLMCPFNIHTAVNFLCTLRYGCYVITDLYLACC